MNIIVPMGGLGTRFQRDGYRHPKPLINIVGRPMILWLIDNLNLTADDTLFFGLNQQIEREFQLSDIVRRELGRTGPNIKVTPLHFDTRGAAETLYIIVQSMTADEKRRKTISLDCDTLYFSDILGMFRQLPTGESACFYFEDLHDNPVFSYIQLGNEGQIVDIREKHKISTHANTGAYAFASALLLEQYCARVLDEGVGTSGEYYTSNVIARMIANKQVFRGIHVQEFACVGTPWQLAQFLEYIKVHKNLVKPRRFCFDLDNTLVTLPQVPEDYSTVLPKQKNIELVRQLKEAGHHIIIATARRMRTHNGNVGAILADVGMVTLETLKKFNIPCDEIHFGKPWAHVYVDDLAVNALLDTEKELGWTQNDHGTMVQFQGGDRMNLISPRSCNTIQVIDDLVIKSSTSERFIGEVFFYEHVPEDIKHLFPRLIRVDRQEPTGYMTLRIERVRGITCSHLMTHRALTEGRLLQVLRALHQIHQSKPATSTSAESSKPVVDIYENYVPKLKSRYMSNKGVYQELAPEQRLDYLYHAIHDYLSQYESARRGLPGAVIHGDPVFSNILLTNDGKVKFIDMRGLQGQFPTLEGDIIYDLAKIYQSLWGYDFVLINRYPMDRQDVEMLARLRDIFREWCQRSYKLSQFRDVEMICASLLFSLIPLHDKLAHQQTFLKMCESIVFPFGIEYPPS